MDELLDTLKMITGVIVVSVILWVTGFGPLVWLVIHLILNGRI